MADPRLSSIAATSPDPIVALQARLVELVRAVAILERKAAIAKVPDSEAWRVVGAVGQPAFQNGWVNFGGGEPALSFYKDPLGIVRIRGLIKSGAVNSVVFTLPVGYRPNIGGGSIRFACMATGALSQCYVNAAGSVVMFSGSNTDVDLSVISFRAEI